MMDLNESNVTKSLSEIAPYIEADGGFVEFVEIEEGTNYVKAVSYTHLTLPTSDLV